MLCLIAISGTMWIHKEPYSLSVSKPLNYLNHCPVRHYWDNYNCQCFWFDSWEIKVMLSNQLICSLCFNGRVWKDACKGLIEPLSKRNALCCLLKSTNSPESLGMEWGCSQVSVVSDKLYKLHIFTIHKDLSVPLESSNFYTLRVSCFADWQCFRPLLSSSYPTAAPLCPSLLFSPLTTQ